MEVLIPTEIEARHFHLSHGSLPSCSESLAHRFDASINIRAVSYPLTLLGNFVYSAANHLHLIPSSSADLELGSYAQVPGTARAEAERRRYLT